jgi:hypothetical protein
MGKPSDQEPTAALDADNGATPSSQALTLGANAEQALKAFYELLNEGEYDRAVDLYGGSYEVLQGWNPDRDPEDFTGLLQAGCEHNGLMCLAVLNIVSVQTSDDNEFFFEIEFANPDGSLFVRGPCCGATEEEMPPQSTFTAQVVCRDGGSCLVMDLPPYVP